MILEDKMYSLTHNKTTVWLENIGEGLSGDYDPEDPDDVNLLRFTVVRNKEQVDDASYCTQLPVDTDIDIIHKALAHVMSEFENNLDNGQLKRTMEWCSWMSPDDFKPNA
jgi:hypothetical protein